MTIHFLYSSFLFKLTMKNMNHSFVDLNALINLILEILSKEIVSISKLLIVDNKILWKNCNFTILRKDFNYIFMMTIYNYTYMHRFVLIFSFIPTYKKIIFLNDLK